MDLNDYLAFCKTTAVYPRILVLKNPTEDQIRRCEAVQVELKDITWVYPLIGLFGEAGELANKLKKVIRDNEFTITPEILDNVEDEKGDLGWYNIILDSELGLVPMQVIKRNVMKLKDRKTTGTIHDNKKRSLNETMNKLAKDQRKERSRLQLFFDILKYLEGEERRPVTGTLLIKELVKTKLFDKKTAKDFIFRLQRCAAIYESRPGYYNKV